MGTTEGPWGWLCGWCGRLCPRCSCDCLPELCPQDPDKLKVDEVSAEDYIDQEKKVEDARIREDNMVKAGLRSCGGYTAGILLTTIYALIVLFVKNYNLWYCLVSTLSIGFFLSLGMAFSVQVRTTVLLMLPQLFSGEGKTMVLIIAIMLAFQGPVANTLENFRRSSESISCGVEQALNQTKELLQKAKRPLVSSLNFFKNIGKRLHVVSDHARKFFRTVIDGVKHIARTLRNVWAFIANIGEVCNEELQAPYIKCNKLFDEGKDNCFKVMSFLGFLCYIVDVFRPLCGLAKIVMVLCVIPFYIQKVVRKYIKNPMVSALRNIKEQFEYNMTVIHKFDITVNASKGLFQVASGIMEEVQENLDPYLQMISMFGYSMMFVCIYTYIMALRYRNKYLFEDNHDNIYITRSFIELDVMRAKQNRSTLLPLSTREAYSFIRPGSFHLTKREKKGYMFEIINVFRSMLIVTFFVLMDYIIFWVMDMVAYLMQGDLVARGFMDLAWIMVTAVVGLAPWGYLHAPLIVSVFVNGTGYASKIFSDMVAAFDVLQRGNITVLSKKCQLRPSEPDFRAYLLIGVMYGLAFFIAACGIYMERLRRSICAYYYPSREQERICFLFNNLLTKRMYIEKSLMKCIRMNMEDEGHSSILLVLAAKCPGFRWLAWMMGANQQYCMACAKTSTTENSDDFLACITNGCKGLYCRGCSEIMENICTICMAPLAYEEDLDEEIDSSDDEKVHLWIEAMKSMKENEKANRKKMRKALKTRLKEIVKRQGGSDRLLQKYKECVEFKDREEGSSGLSDVEDGQESGETDFEYQERSEASDASGQEDLSTRLKQRLEKADLIPRGSIIKTRGKYQRRPSGDVEKGMGQE